VTCNFIIIKRLVAVKVIKWSGSSVCCEGGVLGDGVSGGYWVEESADEQVEVEIVINERAPDRCSESVEDNWWAQIDE
jgi:hypothetical protein